MRAISKGKLLGEGFELLYSGKALFGLFVNGLHNKDLAVDSVTVFDWKLWVDYAVT
jgi:hypothetical protein